MICVLEMTTLDALRRVIIEGDGRNGAWAGGTSGPGERWLGRDGGGVDIKRRNECQG